jgi:hypothetical protein
LVLFQGSTNRPFTAADYKIADELSDYVVNFAATGDPNGYGSHQSCVRHGLPAWPVLRDSKPNAMEVGDAFRPIAAADSPAKYAFSKKWLDSQAVDW